MFYYVSDREKGPDTKDEWQYSLRYTKLLPALKRAITHNYKYVMKSYDKYKGYKRWEIYWKNLWYTNRRKI